MKTTNLQVRRAVSLMALALASTAAACGTIMNTLHVGPQRPAAAEFGLGPRTSRGGMYTVTLEPVEPLAKRKLQAVRVRVRDVDGHAVDDATMLVDGGMPQHGHGLPTKPKMTKSMGNGVYEIGGVRFNMGGWWVFKLAIKSTYGTDTVTFNLAL